MSSFKYGDRVRIIYHMEIADEGDFSQGHVGEEGTICDNHEQCPAVRLDSGRVVDCHRAELEKVARSGEWDFPEGAHVKIIDNRKYHGDQSQSNVGAPGVVVSCSGQIRRVRVGMPPRIVSCHVNELCAVSAHVGNPGGPAILEAVAALRVANKRYEVAVDALPAARAALQAAGAELTKAVAARSEAECAVKAAEAAVLRAFEDSVLQDSN